MVKKEKESKNGFIILLIFFLIILAVSGNFEKTIIEKTKVVEISGREEVYVGSIGFEVFCDEPSSYCDYYDSCDEPIQYIWLSNVVGDSKSDYILISGYGTCVIKYKHNWIKSRW